MTLVKLDSGDYINTEYVIKTMTDTAGSVGKKGGQLVYLVDTGYSRITESDRNRIVEAMGGELGQYFQKLANEQKASLIKTIKRWDATLTDLSKNLSDPCDRVEYTTMSLCLHELKAAVQ